MKPSAKEIEKFSDSISRFIDALIRDFNLPEDAEFSLDSIAVQEKQAEISQDDIKSDLNYAAIIAKRYSDSLAALRKIDYAIPAYLKRMIETRAKIGSFAQLNGCEARLAGRGTLNLDGLDNRIHAYLICDS